MAKAYAISVVRDETGTYKVTEPADLGLEAASFDELIAQVPQAAAEAFNLPAGSAEVLEVHVTIMPPPGGPTGTTGATGTNGLSGASGASGPTGTF